MTFPRDLAWQNLDSVYRSSIACQFARYALGLKYESIPKDVVHQAKRSLLDALGCAIGAYHAPGRPICEGLVGELGGPKEAVVFGSGLRTSDEAWGFPTPRKK
jgi:2-methylcitrate dehydratase PrpD